MTALSPADLATLRAVLARHLPAGAHVAVFGSRAGPQAGRTSDLDLAIDAGGPLEGAILADLREALSETDLPYPVDVVDVRVVSADFATRIRQTWRPLLSL